MAGLHLVELTRIGSQNLGYVQDFPRSYRASPARPTPLDLTPSEPLPAELFRPDFDLILTRFGPEKADFGSESDQNQVKIGSETGLGEGFGGGRVQRGRSSWEGSVAPPESLEVMWRFACKIKSYI